MADARGSGSKPTPYGPQSSNTSPFFGATTIADLARLLAPTLAKLLASYFLPASFGAPPSAKGTSGGRVIATTTLTAPPPIQTGVVALVGGSLTWVFPVAFQSPPIVVPSVQGFDAVAGTSLYVASRSASQVIVTSTDNTDTRAVYLVAIGSPN